MHRIIEAFRLLLSSSTTPEVIRRIGALSKIRGSDSKRSTARTSTKSTGTAFYWSRPPGPSDGTLKGLIGC